MKRILRRVGKVVSIFYPRNIYKILAIIYNNSNQRNRTTELTEIIEEKKYLTFLEVGVWGGDNILELVKKNYRMFIVMESILVITKNMTIKSLKKMINQYFYKLNRKVFFIRSKLLKIYIGTLSR